jgi:argininosuccinate lyase
MALRRAVLDILAALTELRRVLLTIARENIGAIMPGYTHTQPAQPTTLAHYLLGADEMFARDQKRFMSAYETVNLCPMGACAITTTGFPINRPFIAELLGFEGLQLNSWGAIASVDYVTESAAAVSVCMVNLSKFVADLLLWCTPDFGFIRLSDAFVQISSIMPQKRNPVPFEHVRILASKSFAQAHGVLVCAHNTPFGDIVDSEDDLQPIVFSGTTDCLRSLRLIAGALGGAQFNKEQMLRRASANFITATELADTLVREEGLSFRIAHRIVSSAVRICQDRESGSLAEIVAEIAPGILSRPLRLTVAQMKLAADPKRFVEIRGIPGGPGPKAIESALLAAQASYDKCIQWSANKSGLLGSSAIKLSEMAATVREAEA